MTWQVLGVQRQFLAFEAEAVYSGPVYLKNEMVFEGHELVDELRSKQAEQP